MRSSTPAALGAAPETVSAAFEGFAAPRPCGQRASILKSAWPFRRWPLAAGIVIAVQRTDLPFSLSHRR